jgi:uncharacterized protein (TIGR00645 family)
MENTLQKRSPVVRGLGVLIFASRWLQAPLYLGLIITQAAYVFDFFKLIGHLIFELPAIEETELITSVLKLIDIVMISNLLIMVIMGGYETFVSRLQLRDHPDQPEWLSHVNAGILKIKLATALIGISSIHLLQTFMNPGNIANSKIAWQVGIHLTFVVSALLLAYTDRLSNLSAKSH